jgi:hypothetical protein
MNTSAMRNSFTLHEERTGDAGERLFELLPR